MPMEMMFLSLNPPEMGLRIHARIEEEYERARAGIHRVTGREDLMEHASVVRRMIGLRNPAVMPLSRLQVALLDMARGGDTEDDPEAAAWRDALLLSITGIAAAMQSTG